MVQLVFELIVKVVAPAPDPTSWKKGVTDSIFIALWETLTCCEFEPDPDIVIVQILIVSNVFAAYVAVIVLLPFPFSGFTVSQAASSVIVQLVFEWIVNVVLPSPDPTSLLNGITAIRSRPLWVTVTG